MFIRKLRKLAIFGSSIYLGVLLVLSLLESTLMYPAPPPAAGDWQAQWLDHEQVDFTSADGTRLHGWYCAHPATRRAILICHGNGEDVSHLAEELDFFREFFQADVFAFDYRGYGLSEGRPHEAGILADGEAAMRWLSQRSGRPLDQIVLYGRSLGGAVVVHLAATHGAGALVLDRTFSSMVDVAASHFPWLPVRLMLRNRYPSSQRIAAYHGPLLQIHGQPDEVVPYRLARALFAACPSTNKQFVTSATLTHNAPWPQEYYLCMRSFLSQPPEDNAAEND